MDKNELYGQKWIIWTKMDNMDRIGQYGQIVQYGQNWTKMKNMDKIGQYGQNWTIWTKLKKLEKIGQYGQYGQS